MNATTDVAAGLAALDLDREAAAEKIASRLCDRCGKRFAEHPCPDGEMVCTICLPSKARAILRAAKAERRRQARMFPKAMTVPKGKR